MLPTVPKLFFLLTSFIVSVSAFGQTVSFGGKAGYLTYHRTYSPSIVVEGTQVYQHVNSASFRDGWHFAAFSQLNYQRLALRLSGAYTFNIGGDNFVTINNRNNPANDEPYDNWTIGTSNKYHSWEVSMAGGYKVYSWLTLWVGPSLWHQRILDPKPYEIVDLSSLEDPHDEWENINRMNKFGRAVQESYVPWVLAGKLEAEAEFRQFLFGIAYDKSLTPVGHELEYEDKEYFFRQSADRYVVSIGFIFPTMLSLSKKQ